MFIRFNRIVKAFTLLSSFGALAAQASRPSMYCGQLDSAKVEQVRDPVRPDMILEVKAEAMMSHAAGFNPGDKLPVSDSKSEWNVKITDLRAVQTSVRVLLDDYGLNSKDFVTMAFDVSRLPSQSTVLCVEAADYVEEHATLAHKIYRLWAYRGSDLLLFQDLRD